MKEQPRLPARLLPIHPMPIISLRREQTNWQDHLVLHDLQEQLLLLYLHLQSGTLIFFVAPNSVVPSAWRGTISLALQVSVNDIICNGDISHRLEDLYVPASLITCDIQFTFIRLQLNIAADAGLLNPNRAALLKLYAAPNYRVGQNLDQTRTVALNISTDCDALRRQ
jgi:hypothetical protein